MIVVVGGGQAGLAIGWHLARAGRDFTILEAAAEPAAAWRERWDSLRLFTPARYSGLPGLPFPGDPDAHPGRDDVVAYLSDYAQRFDLPVELGVRVQRVRPADGGGYAVEAGDRVLEAEHVVIATGPFQVPRVPGAAEALDGQVVQLHSSAYRRPSDLPAGPVLVVGAGNTGCQIAEDLAAAGSHQVHLAVGSRQLPLPQRLLGRDLFWYLDRTGLMAKTVSSRIGRRMSTRETLVGTSPRTARRRGVHLHPRAVEASGRRVGFADGTGLDAGAVVWATGFGLDHSFVEAPVLDPRGRIAHERGVTAAPGLYVLGMPWQHTRGSALLGWVKDDAAYLADRIAAAGS